MRRQLDKQRAHPRRDDILRSIMRRLVQGEHVETIGVIMRQVIAHPKRRAHKVRVVGGWDIRGRHDVGYE